MHVKSQPQNDFFGQVGFGLVVFWSSCLLVELSLVKLVLVDLSWASCRLIELSHIPFFHVRSQRSDDESGERGERGDKS
jgi:hypothetical protein